MLPFSVCVPSGFSTLGGLVFLESRLSGHMSAHEVEALNQGEDLMCAEHLLLNAGVHLDAVGDVFMIQIFTSDGESRSRRTAVRLQDAIGEFELTLRTIWSVEVPWRDPDTMYSLAPHEEAAPGDSLRAWVVPGGWTILLDLISANPDEEAIVGVAPLRLVFASTSSHRSIAVYQINHGAAPAPYAGFLWADPVGLLYERVFFPDAQSIVGWLRARLRNGPLPRRKKRR